MREFSACCVRSSIQKTPPGEVRCGWMQRQGAPWSSKSEACRPHGVDDIGRCRIDSGEYLKALPDADSSLMVCAWTFRWAIVGQGPPLDKRPRALCLAAIKPQLYTSPRRETRPAIRREPITVKIQTTVFLRGISGVSGTGARNRVCRDIHRPVGVYLHQP